MDTQDELRVAIASVFAEWEKLPRIGKGWRIRAVMDEKRDQYVLLHVEDSNDQYNSRLLAHLEIWNNKIWIITDMTEEGIGNELVALNVSKDKIVLALYPPSIREMGEFAVT